MGWLPDTTSYFKPEIQFFSSRPIIFDINSFSFSGISQFQCMNPYEHSRCCNFPNNFTTALKSYTLGTVGIQHHHSLIIRDPLSAFMIHYQPSWSTISLHDPLSAFMIPTSVFWQDPNYMYIFQCTNPSKMMNRDSQGGMGSGFRFLIRLHSLKLTPEKSLVGRYVFLLWWSVLFSGVLIVAVSVMFFSSI